LLVFGPVVPSEAMRPRSLVIAGIGLALVLAVVSAASERGLRRVHRLSGEVARIEALNADLEAENRRLALEIEALRHDTAALESVARDELGLVRPGERVFRFEGPGR
jgi:cell division protein FtsB